MSARAERHCCIIDNAEICRRVATSTRLSKNMKNRLDEKKIGFAPNADVDHNYICSHHTSLIHTLIPDLKNKRKRARVMHTDSELPQVNFSVLNQPALRRYQRHYDLSEATTKADLIVVIEQHFGQQPVNEIDTIRLFTKMVKRGGNKLDLR